MSAKKVLFISYDGLTDPLGQSQVLPYLTGLARRDYEIHILSAEKAQNFAKRQNAIEEIIAKHRLHWHYITYSKRPPVLSTLYDVRRLGQKARQLHHKVGFDIIHCRSYIAALVGQSLKKRYGLKFIFDMRGFWADERVDGNLWNLQNPLFRGVYRFFKRKERAFLQEADCTISLTHNAKQEIESWQLEQAAPIKVIPCCVDLELFRPSEHSSLDKPFALSYLGSIGTWYMLREMLEFFKVLREKRPEAKFLFITTDSPELITKEAQDLGIPSESLHIQSAERREVPQLLAQSEVAIFFIKPLFSKKASSATKMGEILAMGIPIITNLIGDHEWLFQQYQFGYLLRQLQPEAYAEAIAAMPKIAQIPPEKLRQAAEAYFSLEEGVKRYTAVYQNVLK